MASPILFKSSDVERQWDSDSRKHPMLDLVVGDFADAAYEEAGWLPVMTSFIRTYEEDRELGGSGIHPTGRAADFRTRGVPRQAVSWAVDYLNGKYQYDPRRPSLPVAYAKPHGNGPHLHIQVHDETVLRPGFRTGGDD